MISPNEPGERVLGERSDDVPNECVEAFLAQRKKRTKRPKDFQRDLEREKQATKTEKWARGEAWKNHSNQGLFRPLVLVSECDHPHEHDDDCSDKLPW